MTKLDENLSEIFDVDPIKPATELIEAEIVETPITPISNNPVAPVVTEHPDDTEMEEDFEKARNNTEDLLTKGKIALEAALDIVQQSDQPRAIEVFSTLLGQLSKVNQELLELHARRREIKNARPESEQGPKTVNNNAIFVGTSAELNKMIANMTGQNNAT